MIHVFFGQEDFEKDRAIARLKSDLGDQQMLSLNTTVLDSPNFTLDQLRAACDTVPFLSPQRLVIASGLLGRFESAAGKEDLGDVAESAVTTRSGSWRTFADYLGQVPPFTVVVLSEGSLKAGNSLLKALRPLANVVEFRPLSGSSLLNWVAGEIESLDGKISSGAARLLAEIVGNNLWVLSSELGKLAAYARGRTVTEQDVKLLVSYAREANIFAMVDAIVERRQATALKLFHQLMVDGVSPPHLSVMITRQYRMMLQLKLLQNQGLSKRDQMARLGISLDFVVDKAIQQAVRYSIEGLEDVYGRLLDLDVATKTGLVDGSVAMEILIAELSSGGRTARAN